MKIEVALISVSDKTGLVELAGSLAGLGIKILSTGGSGRTLKDAGIPIPRFLNIQDFLKFWMAVLKHCIPGFTPESWRATGNRLTWMFSRKRIFLLSDWLL